MELTDKEKKLIEVSREAKLEEIKHGSLTLFIQDGKLIRYEKKESIKTK